MFDFTKVSSHVLHLLFIGLKVPMLRWLNLYLRKDRGF